MALLVDQIVQDMLIQPLDKVLHDVAAKKYNERITNLWPNVVRSDGVYLASGLLRTVKCGEELVGGDLPDGSSMVGMSVNEHAALEAGVPQPHLWDRMTAAALDDGYFEFIGWDNFHVTSDSPPPFAVMRIGYARFAETSNGTVLVSAAVSNMPFQDSFTSYPCRAEYDGLCSVSYTRKIVGQALTAMLTASTEAELESVFAQITWKKFNQYGFYPYVYEFDGPNVAHGMNRALLGRDVVNIINSVPALRQVITGEQLSEALQTSALQGGTWVTFDWTTFHNDVFEKVAFSVGVRLFGREYFVGSGYTHKITPLIPGPQCLTCNSDFNYPCSWATCVAAVGHAKTLLLMTNRYSREQAFRMLNENQEYRLPGEFYTFVYDFNGTCVSHILPQAVGNKLWTVIDSIPQLAGKVDAHKLHERLVETASKGGGWVNYLWISNGESRVESKWSYVVRVNRGGRSYYFGSGLGDTSWRAPPCSQRYSGPCAEDAAASLSGSLVSLLIKAHQLDNSLDATELQLQSMLATQPGATPFAATVQANGKVVADGWNSAFVGMSTSGWFLNVRLPFDVLDGLDSIGTWTGPVLMSPDGVSLPAPHLLLFTSVTPVEDITYSIIVAVRHEPMPAAVQANGTCSTVVCNVVHRDTVGLLGHANASDWSESRALATVQCAEPQVDEKAYCQCSTGFAASFHAQESLTASASLQLGHEQCSSVAQLMHTPHAMLCSGRPPVSCETGWLFDEATLQCRPCPAGTQQEGETCEPCRVGRVSVLPGSPCAPCTEGYTDEPGMSVCKTCPENSVRLLDSAGESVEECKCKTGFYRNTNDFSQPCVECPSGGVCEEGRVYPAQGFWGDRECARFGFGGSAECDEVVFFECDPSENCEGGDEFKCKAGRRGRMCLEAEDGWFIIGNKFWSECGPSGHAVTIVGILCVLSGWVIIEFFISEKYDALNCVLLFVQMAARIGNFGLRWHSYLSTLNLAFTVLDFDVDFVTPLCLGAWSAVSSFYLQLMMPVVLVTASILWTLVHSLVRGRPVSAKRIWHHAWQSFYKTVFIIFHTLTINCVQVFMCEEYPSGRQFVRAIPSLECWTGTHLTMVVTASLYFPLVLGGVMVSTVYWVQREISNGTLHSPATVKSWDFYHSQFETDWKQWGAVLVFRRFAIALISVLDITEMLKAALAIVILTLLLAAHVFTRPYIDSYVDVLDFSCMCGLIFYAMVGMLMYPSITADAQGHLCAENMADGSWWCESEDTLKHNISIGTLAMFGIIFLITAILTYSSVKEVRDAASAKDRIKKEFDREAIKNVATSVNKVDLETILNGTVVNRWMKVLHNKRPADNSLIVLPSAESFMVVDTLIRSVEHDVTQYSDTALANLLRTLCDIPGILEFVCSAQAGPATAGLLAFVQGMAAFDEKARECEVDLDRSSPLRRCPHAIKAIVAQPFPITSLTHFEHRPVLFYALLTSTEIERRHFSYLMNAMRSANQLAEMDILHYMLEQPLLGGDEHQDDGFTRLNSIGEDTPSRLNSSGALISCGCAAQRALESVTRLQVATDSAQGGAQFSSLSRTRATSQDGDSQSERAEREESIGSGAHRTHSGSSEPPSVHHESSQKHLLARLESGISLTRDGQHWQSLQKLRRLASMRPKRLASLGSRGSVDDGGSASICLGVPASDDVLPDALPRRVPRQDSEAQALRNNMQDTRPDAGKLRSLEPSASAPRFSSGALVETPWAAVAPGLDVGNAALASAPQGCPDIRLELGADSDEEGLHGVVVSSTPRADRIGAVGLDPRKCKQLLGAGDAPRSPHGPTDAKGTESETEGGLGRGGALVHGGRVVPGEAPAALCSGLSAAEASAQVAAAARASSDDSQRLWQPEMARASMPVLMQLDAADLAELGKLQVGLGTDEEGLQAGLEEPQVGYA